MEVEKLPLGMGDRFARLARAQLRDAGTLIFPFWNKSNRENTIIHSQPDEARAEADDTVRAFGWDGACYVDADHIGLKTADAFAVPWQP